MQTKEKQERNREQRRRNQTKTEDARQDEVAAGAAVAICLSTHNGNEDNAGSYFSLSFSLGLELRWPGERHMRHVLSR